MKAANVTDSWIITTGVNTGVSKLGKTYYLSKIIYFSYSISFI